MQAGPERFMKGVQFLWQPCLCSAERCSADNIHVRRQGGFHGAALHVRAAEAPPSPGESALWSGLKR